MKVLIEKCFMLKKAYTDLLFAIIYVIYLGGFLYGPLLYLKNLGIASKLTILLEQVRFLMKTHAFVSSNIRKFFKSKI